MNRKHGHDYFKNVANRLFIALDTQTTALISQYGHDTEKWPEHMRDALSALEYATACDCCKWRVVKAERKRGRNTSSPY